MLDERNVHWWQPSQKDQKQRLTLTFDQPVDPSKTPFLSVLVFFGQNKSLPFRWRVRPFTGHDPQSKWDDAIAAALAADQSHWTQGHSQETAACTLSTDSTFFEFATNTDKQSGRATKYAYEEAFGNGDECFLQAAGDICLNPWSI